MAYTPYTDGSYRIRQGFHPASVLTTAYNLTALPKQTGQGRVRWFKPVDNTNIYDPGQQVERSLGRTAKFIGDAGFTWTLAGLLPQMVYFIQNDPALFDGKVAQEFTVMTWDRGGAWPVVWATAYRGLLSEIAEPGWRQGYYKYNLEFVVKQAAPAGPDMTLNVTPPASPTIPGDNNYLVQGENEGDYTTIGDIVITMDVPAGMTFVSVPASSGFTLRYFENGVWVTTVTTPGDVTRVEATRNTALAAGGVTSNIAIRFTIPATGTYTFDASVSTAGDADPSNDDVSVESTWS